MTDEYKPDALAFINGLAEKDPQFPQVTAGYKAVQAMASRLKAMRQRNGLSQADLGKALGVSQGRISQIESGLVDYAPSLDMIARYAAVCREEMNLSFSGENKDEIEESLREMAAWNVSIVGWRRDLTNFHDLDAVLMESASVSTAATPLVYFAPQIAERKAMPGKPLSINLVKDVLSRMRPGPARDAVETAVQAHPNEIQVQKVQSGVMLRVTGAAAREVTMAIVDAPTGKTEGAAG